MLCAVVTSHEERPLEADLPPQVKVLSQRRVDRYIHAKRKIRFSDKLNSDFASVIHQMVHQVTVKAPESGLMIPKHVYNFW
jgi:hypothetical protein